MTEEQTEQKLESARSERKKDQRSFAYRYFGAMAVFLAGAMLAAGLEPARTPGPVPVLITLAIVGTLALAAVVWARYVLRPESRSTFEFSASTNAAATAFYVIWLPGLAYVALKGYLSLPDLGTWVFTAMSVAYAASLGYFMSRGGGAE